MCLFRGRLDPGHVSISGPAGSGACVYFGLGERGMCLFRSRLPTVWGGNGADGFKHGAISASAGSS